MNVLVITFVVTTSHVLAGEERGVPNSNRVPQPVLHEFLARAPFRAFRDYESANILITLDLGPHQLRKTAVVQIQRLKEESKNKFEEAMTVLVLSVTEFLREFPVYSIDRPWQRQTRSNETLLFQIERAGPIAVSRGLKPITENLRQYLFFNLVNGKIVDCGMQTKPFLWPIISIRAEPSTCRDLLRSGFSGELFGFRSISGPIILIGDFKKVKDE